MKRVLVGVGVAAGVFAAGLGFALTLASRGGGKPDGATTTTAITEPDGATTTTAITEPDGATTTTAITEPTAPPLFGESYKAILEALKDLEPANIAFNAPKTLGVGDTAVIQLLLSLDKPISDLQAELTEVGEPRGATVKVSPRMVAVLEGDEGLKVKPTVPNPERLVSQGRETEWEWLVTATKSGNRTLLLTLYALVAVNGRDLPPAEVQTYQAKIAIDVTWTERITGFVGDNWKWLWTSILVPLAAFAWAAWKRRQRHRSSSPSRSSSRVPMRGRRRTRRRGRDSQGSH